MPKNAAGDHKARNNEGGDTLRLTTVRSNDQFNTTVYDFTDRLRGVDGTRMVVFMNEKDIARLGFRDGDTVNLQTVSDDDIRREVQGFRIVSYAIAQGCAAAYFPEASPLVPLSHHEAKSCTPAYKAIPVRVMRNAVT